MASRVHTRQVILVLLYALAAIRIVASYLHIVTTSAPDFVYYFDASLSARGVPSVTGHLLPPFSLPAFWPLALVDFGLSQILWISALFVALLSIPILLRALFPRMTAYTGAVMVALFTWSFPTLFTLGMGQVNMIVLSLLLVSALLYTKHYYLTSGFVMGIYVLFKPEMLLLSGVPILIADKKTRYAYITTLLCAVLLSVAAYGWGAYTEFFDKIVSVFLSTGEAGVYYNQSASAFLMRSGISDSGIRMTVSAVILIAGYWVITRRKSGHADAMWSMLPVFIVSEPVAFQHHYIFLIPSYIAAWYRTVSVAGRGLIILSFLLVSINIANPEALQMLPLGNIALSHATIGAFILMAILLR